MVAGYAVGGGNILQMMCDITVSPWTVEFALHLSWEKGVLPSTGAQPQSLCVAEPRTVQWLPENCACDAV